MNLALDARLVGVAPGGIATYASALGRLIPALDRERRHLHLIRRGVDLTLSPLARTVRCWTPAHHRWERVALAAELLPHRVDLLHATDFVAPRAGYRRLVVSVHDLAFLRRPEILTAAARRHYGGTRSSAARADVVIADSLAIKRDVMELLGTPEDRIAVVPLGRDEACYPRAADDVARVLARYGLSPGYLLCVGTFEPRKNLPGTLRMYRRLLARRPDAPPLVLAGFPGPDSAAVTLASAAPELRGRVRVLESVPPDDLPFLHSGAGVFVLLSDDEGFGLPVVDAMASGTPCVLSDRGALPEVGGDAVALVDPRDAESASGTIEQILTDSERATGMRVRGLRRAACFTWDETARLTAAVYDRALA